MNGEPGPPVRIVIDALAARFGGAAYSVIQVAHGLAQDPAVRGVALVARRDSMVWAGVPRSPRLDLIELPPAGAGELWKRAAWEAVRLPQLLDQERTALLHWAGTLPRRVACPTVCYLANPVVFLNGGRMNAIRRLAVRRTAGWAAGLLVPTRGMGELVEAETGRACVVVPHGVDHERFRPAGAPGDEVLAVADFYPHKRHEVLLAAWAALPAPRPVLRLIGDRTVDTDHGERVMEEVERFRHLGRIEVQSGLGLHQLVDAYHRARVMVITSDRESFSMPLLEALACGVPAVVRDLASLHETGGPETTYVHGDDPNRWATAVEALFIDDEEHRRRAKAGMRHAATYSWARTTASFRDQLLAATRKSSG